MSDPHTDISTAYWNTVMASRIRSGRYTTRSDTVIKIFSMYEDMTPASSVSHL